MCVLLITDHIAVYTTVYNYMWRIIMILIVYSVNFTGTVRSFSLELCVWSHQCLLTKLLHLTAIQGTGGARTGRRIPSVSYI